MASSLSTDKLAFCDTDILPYPDRLASWLGQDIGGGSVWGAPSRLPDASGPVFDTIRGSDGTLYFIDGTVLRPCRPRGSYDGGTPLPGDEP